QGFFVPIGTQNDIRGGDFLMTAGLILSIPEHPVRFYFNWHTSLEDLHHPKYRRDALPCVPTALILIASIGAEPPTRIPDRFMPAFTLRTDPI
ncbi:MAG: hypothetical protein JSV37_02715, partial [Anaerolineaceae bacterium]